MDLITGPTAERMEHVRGLDIELPQVDRQTARKNWRIVCVVESLRKAGEINDDCYSAYQRFERDMALASAMPALISRYGASAGVGTTPASQMLPQALDRLEARDERREHARRRVKAVMDAIPWEPRRNALLLAVTSDLPPAEIGRHVSRYKGRCQAEAIAKEMLREALWQVHTTYLAMYSQSQTAP